MGRKNDIETPRADIGLCATCRNAREIKSDRGSVFYMCLLSLTDARFPKYPALPVRACSGYASKP